MEFTTKQADVLAEIEALQAKLPGLEYHTPHQSVSTGPLIPGCEICVRKGYLSFQVGFACNARCPFCFLETTPPDQRHEDEPYHRSALLKHFLRHVGEWEGVSLSGGEPLLYLPELAECVGEMRAAQPGLHFWLYTNGILADEEHLRAVLELGITEIRFNLAATNYGEVVLANLALAREIFPHLAVEVPCYPPQRQALLACLPELERIGIDQLNLQELWVTPSNVNDMPGEGYQAGVLFRKKHFLVGSRRLTYEAMARCLEEGYRLTVNDCTASAFGRA
jgi:pyruvate formate-lyase activating enzyme-like uncharacterized protein